jgi:hypothetical protein
VTRVVKGGSAGICSRCAPAALLAAGGRRRVLPQVGAGHGARSFWFLHLLHLLHSVCRNHLFTEKQDSGQFLFGGQSDAWLAVCISTSDKYFTATPSALARVTVDDVFPIFQRSP